MIALRYMLIRLDRFTGDIFKSFLGVGYLVRSACLLKASGYQALRDDLSGWSRDALSLNSDETSLN